MPSNKVDYVIVGRTGWIGGSMAKLMEAEGLNFTFLKARMQNLDAVAQELEELKPQTVICCAGLTGRPNVDWCESHKQEVIRVNVIGTLGLVDLCYQKGIHVVNFATGCIFKYDKEHTIGGTPFTEEDDGNFEGSFYSKTKGMVERMLREYDNCLTLRVRMPINDDLLNVRNFVTKISTYERVVNIPNSMTVLDDMLPLALKAAQRKLTGIYNFCNPGPISHNEILDMYKEIIDPTFTYKNFTEEEQNKILVAERSNNTLCGKKFSSEFPEVLEIHEAMRQCFLRMKERLDSVGWTPDQHPKFGGLKEPAAKKQKTEA
jgi:3,5-epimerase/4-reductase